MTPKVRPIAPHLRALLDYDPESGTLTWKTRPLRSDGRPNNAIRPGSEAGWLDVSTGYRRVGVLGTQIHAHRLAYFLFHDAWPEEIDHVNGDKTDNRIANLRAASHAENLRNVKRRADNTSGHPGVSWSRRDKKWYAYIRVDGKTRSLGRHDTLEDAIAARRRGEIAFHATFAQHTSRTPE